MLEVLLEPVLYQRMAGMALAVIVHELGHAAAQKLFGIPVTLIEWGRGPRLLKLGVLEIRLIPFSGCVVPNGAELAPGRFAAVLIALAGIMAQWIGMVLIGRLHLHEISGLGVVCITYGFCAFISLLVLVPLKGSDGYHMIRALRRRAS